MRILTILLPEPVHRAVEQEAGAKGVDPTALCTSILTEHFLALPTSPRQVSQSAEKIAGEEIRFNVNEHFNGLPRYSIDFAQAIVDEATKMPGVRAFRSNRGVGFDPNFVFIEYLRERTPGGIGLSLYGGPERHQNKVIREGRTPSYSRARIETPAELQLVLPHVRKAFALKFGR